MSKRLTLAEFLYAEYVKLYPGSCTSMDHFISGISDIMKGAQAYTDQEVAAALAEAKPQTEDPEKVRREIATAAMQGMIAANVGIGTEGKAEYAVKYADALIAELAKKKGGENE